MPTIRLLMPLANFTFPVRYELEMILDEAEQ